MQTPFRCLALVALLAIAACSSAPPAPQTVISFARYQPIYLNVSRIDFTEDYKSPGAPNIEQTMPYSPAEAMKIWKDDRLRAVGGDHWAQIIIKDGGVVETDLPTNGGLASLFTTQQDKRYDAKLEVEMRIYGPEQAMSVASLNISVTHSVTTPENISQPERDEIFRKLIFDLMKQANAELEKNIFQYFGGYIDYSKMP